MREDGAGRRPPRASEAHRPSTNNQRREVLRRHAKDTEGEAAGGAGAPCSSASLFSVASTSAGSFT